MAIKCSCFVKNLKISCSLDHTILFKFHWRMKQTFLKECMESLPMSALATVAQTCFDGKFYSKKWFSDRAFYVIIADADIGSLKSLHTLFDKYLDHMLAKLEQNRMVRNIQNFVVFDKKWSTIFDKVLTPFWKTFLWLKQLFDAKILIKHANCVFFLNFSIQVPSMFGKKCFGTNLSLTLVFHP